MSDSGRAEHRFSVHGRQVELRFRDGGGAVGRRIIINVVIVGFVGS